MITAYFDDSGTSPSNSVVVTAGYIGSAAQWTKFTLQWNGLLSEFGITKMHRGDLESLQREYLAWTPEKRKLLVHKAQEIIRQRTYTGLGNSVIKADFEAVFPPILKKFYGGAYGYCAFLCIARAKNWFDKTNTVDPIDWVFEAGTEGSGQFDILMRALYANPDLRRNFRVNTWSFRDKATIPLQAADVLAYEIYKHITNQIVKGGKRNVRLSFDHLVRPRDSENLEHWPKNRLEEYVESSTAKSLIQSLQEHGFS